MHGIVYEKGRLELYRYEKINFDVVADCFHFSHFCAEGC